MKRKSSNEIGNEIISLVDRDLVINLEQSGINFGIYFGTVLNGYTGMQYQKFEQGRERVMGIATFGLEEARKYLEDRLGKNVSFRNTRRAGVLVPQLIGYTDEGFWNELSRIDSYAGGIATKERALKDIQINQEAIACLHNSLRFPSRVD